MLYHFYDLVIYLLFLKNSTNRLLFHIPMTLIHHNTYQQQSLKFSFWPSSSIEGIEVTLGKHGLVLIYLTLKDICVSNTTS